MQGLMLLRASSLCVCSLMFTAFLFRTCMAFCRLLSDTQTGVMGTGMGMGIDGGIGWGRLLASLRTFLSFALLAMAANWVKEAGHLESVGRNCIFPVVFLASYLLAYFSLSPLGFLCGQVWRI